MARALVIDIETLSGADLTAIGPPKYAEDPSTRVDRVGWSFDGKAQVWKPDETRGVPPDDLVAATAACDRVVAFNATFDATVLAAKLPEWNIPAEKWACLMHRALAGGLRNKGAASSDEGSAISLADAIELAGGPDDLRKTDGKNTGYDWSAK